MSLNSFGAGARFYDEALALGDLPAPEEAELRFRRARGLHLAGSSDREEALEEAHDALLSVDDPERAAEADQWIHKQAPHVGQWGPADHAVDMVKRIKSPHLLANSATWVARGLIRRSERD